MHHTPLSLAAFLLPLLALSSAQPSTGAGTGYLYPRSWALGPRDPDGMIHLGDDGILRDLVTRSSSLGRRDITSLHPHWEVRSAVALSPEHIARHVEDAAQHSETLGLHLRAEFEGVDGRDVHPRDALEPDPELLPRGPGPEAEAAEAGFHVRMWRRGETEDGGLLLRRGSWCKKNSDCAPGHNCLGKDGGPYGNCDQPFIKSIP